MLPIIILAAAGLLVSAIGWLAKTDRLPRNGMAGIRLPSTMKSDEAWFAGHRAGSLPLVVAGIGPVVVLVIALIADLDLHGDLALLGIDLVWFLIWVTLATVRANRAAKAV